MLQNKRHIALFFGKTILVFSIFILQGYRSSNTNTLTVKITNLKYKCGLVEIGLYAKGDKFPKPGKQFKMARVKVEGNIAIATFPGLKNGDYAIAVYHDQNADKCCNKNMFGVPTEAYAFSNNVRPFLSAPSFKSCRFWVTDKRTLSIKMIY